MNIDLINQTLEVTENPGLDIFDPRFSDITTLVQNGDYLGAAGQAEEILTENIYDIRIIGYFLYGVFFERGVGVLVVIFQTLSGLLEENWEAIGPVKKREKHVQTSVNWFMKMLLKKLQYEEQKKSSDWNQWVDAVSSDEIQEILDACDTLRRTLGKSLEDAAGPILDGLMKVKDWLSSFQKVVYREPEPEPEPEPEGEPEPDTVSALEPESEISKSGPADQVGLIDTNIMSKGAGKAHYAEGSYYLKMLLKKLEAFELLIREEKFPGAAIVADDINNIIAHFDPKMYFPRLFSKFSLLMALNIGELASFNDHKKTLEWQTLEELYKVDLDAFIEFKFEGLHADSPIRNDQPNEQYEEDDEIINSSDSGDDDNDDNVEDKDDDDWDDE